MNRIQRASDLEEVPAAEAGFRPPRFVLGRIVIWTCGLLWILAGFASYSRRALQLSALEGVSSEFSLKHLAMAADAGLWLLVGLAGCWILERILQTFSQWE